jgi:hypothetical protein
MLRRPSRLDSYGTSAALAAVPSIRYFHTVDANGPCHKTKSVIRCPEVYTIRLFVAPPSKRFENPYFVCYATVVSILSRFRDVIGERKNQPMGEMLQSLAYEFQEYGG